ncbi:MAG: hypothetical protein ACRD8U_20445, partial [Pyrinomonadaceae bacterium]
VPLFAQKGKPGRGGSTGGCAVVTTPTLSTESASPGMNVGVFGRIGNCAGGKKRYTVRVSSMSSCSLETVVSSSVVTFSGGEYKLISVAYPIAPGTCVGPMSVTLGVYESSLMLASGSATLMVQ